MESDAPARDHHHSSEEEEMEAPSPGSSTDSQQGDLDSSRAERKACREANKRSLNDDMGNKENKNQEKS